MPGIFRLIDLDKYQYFYLINEYNWVAVPVVRISKQTTILSSLKQIVTLEKTINRYVLAK